MMKAAGVTNEEEYRALACRGGGETVVERRPLRRPGAGEVLVSLRACGLCGTDVFKLEAGDQPPGTVLGHEEPGSDRSVGCGAHVEQIGTRERQGSSTVRCSEAVARSGETSRRAATGSRGLSMRERSRITDRRQDRSERSSRVSLASSCQSVRLLLLSSAANTTAVRSSTRFTSGKPRGVIASFRSPPLPPPARCGVFPPRRSPPLGCRDSAAS